MMVLWFLYVVLKKISRIVIWCFMIVLWLIMVFLWMYVDVWCCSYDCLWFLVMSYDVRMILCWCSCDSNNIIMLSWLYYDFCMMPYDFLSLLWSYYAYLWLPYDVLSIAATIVAVAVVVIVVVSLSISISTSISSDQYHPFNIILSISSYQ